MARFGNWAPLAGNWAAQPRLTTPDIICIHTMVGSLAGTDGMFRRNGFGGTFSHFGIGGDGSCTQWQDTDFKAAANYNGNHRIISVECADIGAPFASWNTSDGGAVPAFSDAQVETLAHLVATIAPAHNIPIVLIPDAKPGRRGVGYHRLGVPGYMVAGAEQWSSAQGKVCPGNRRIAQIPQIIARAQQILTPEEDDDFMALFANLDQFTKAVNRASNCYTPDDRAQGGGTWPYDQLTDTRAKVIALQAKVDAQADSLRRIEAALAALANTGTNPTG